MEAMEAMEVAMEVEDMEVDDMEDMAALATVTIILTYTEAHQVDGIGGQHIRIMSVKLLKTIIMEIVFI